MHENMYDDINQNFIIETDLLRMLFKLGLDTYEKFTKFRKNIIVENFYFYTDYIYKKFNYNIPNRIWLKTHKLKNNDQRKYIEYLEKNGNSGSFRLFSKDIENKAKIIYDDIEKNSLTKQNILDKINKIEELGIGHLRFIKNKTFQGEYNCINKGKYETANKKEIEWANIDWTFTDGEKNWNTPTKEKEYSFNINKAQYILTIKCNWCSYFHTMKNLTINTFNFDINTMPTKNNFEKPSLEEELQEKLDKKYQKYKNTNDAEKPTNIITEQLKKVKELINNKSYDHLIILFNILNNIEGFEQDIDFLLELITPEYKKEFNMSKEEINNVIKRTKQK